MAKVKPKDFLIQKGEKIVLGIGLAVFALMLVLGITTMLGADSPSAKANAFKSIADKHRADINRDQGDPGVPPLSVPDYALKEIDPKLFRSPYLPFETVDQPSNKRDNPVVLGINDAQVDLVRAPIKAYEVIRNDDGSVKIGLLYNVKLGSIDADGIRKLFSKQKAQVTRSNLPPPPPVPNPMQPMQPIQPPAAMGGGRGENRGGGGAPTVANGDRSEKTLRYVPLEDLDKETAKPDVVPALAVYPTRMIVVNASFPLKEQLEVIRRALRLKTIADASALTATPPSTVGPTFAGFEVERKIVAPNGQVYDWTPYDHVGQYLEKIAVRKFADQQDDGLLSYFMRYEQMMCMPLPALAANIAVYPGVRLDSIVRGYRKLQDANKKPVVASEFAKKFDNKEGSSNPFQPSLGAPTGTSGAASLGGFGGEAAPSGITPGRGGRGESGRQAMAETVPGGVAAVPSNMPELEHLLIRFLDVDIRAGFTYQYRLRVKMKNPNFNSKEVNRPEDAKKEVLEGPWVTIANEISVPSDRNMYAGDPITYAERVRRDFKDPAVVNLLDNKGGDIPIVQFQSWTEKIAIDSGKTEPAGYWVVSEVPVNRGEFVGRKQIVPLPMWSSEKLQFILQTIPKYVVKNAREQPKGLMVDFTSPTMLVDYEGGKVRAKLGDKSIDDDAEIDMLFLNADGTVMVRNSAVDRANADRAKREDAWRKWLDMLKAETEKAGPLSTPNVPQP